MRLTYTGKVFIIESTFEERHLPKGAGFLWDPDGSKCGKPKHWWTADPVNASKLLAYADDSCRAQLAAIQAQRKETAQMSRATNAEIEIPIPEGLAYLPFQRAGIKFMADRTGVLLGDEMGLGKTIQVLGLINLDASIESVLAFVPASLKLNWRKEAERFLVRKFNFFICQGAKISDRILEVMPKPRFVIINYDIATGWGPALKKESWDLLVLDECHYVKEPKAQRTKAILGDTVHKIPRPDRNGNMPPPPIIARRKVFATGTPILNRPAELWTLIHTLDPQTWNSQWKFNQQFCDPYATRFGTSYEGGSNLEELQDTLRSTCMVRRLKADVLKELPAKRRQIITISAEGFEEIILQETEAYEAHEEKLAELRAAMELAKASGTEEDYKEAVQNLRDEVAVAFADISRLRHQTALAKVPAVIDHIKTCREAGSGKIILFGHHRDVLGQLSNAFPGEAVLFYGGMTPEAKDAAVRSFQEDPRIWLFVGGIHAAGLGITLTASSQVVLSELDWTPARVTQAEDRAHRIGQRDSVLVQHLVIDGSLDAKMAKTLVSKQELIDAAMDNISEVEAEEPVLPAAENNRPASEGLTRKQIEKESESISPESIAAVHDGLKILAGMCDGAVALDGMGFNKIDAMIGHSLAECRTLTARQAILGRRVASKYVRQLGEERIARMKG